MVCHLAALAGIVLSFIGIPPVLFINILGPLVVWLWKKNEHPFIDEQGKESINFQISLTIYSLVLVIILGIVGAIFLLFAGGAASSGSDAAGGVALGILGLGIGGIVVMMIGFTIIQLLFVIFAAIKAKGGQSYRYPFTMRLVK